MKDSSPDIIDNFQWLHAPVPGLGWGAWACIATLLIVLLAFCGWYLLRRTKLGIAFFAPPPPHEVALRALNECRRLKLSEEKQREFVVEVSQIVRVYIQARFGIRAPHRSTEEFLREVHEGDRLLQEHQESLGSFLTGSDLVKFAQRRVLIEQMAQMIEGARSFVEASIPSPQSQPMEKKGL